MSFVHLHTKSEYSILNSTVRIKDLVARAVDYNMPAVALTDSNNLYGAVELYSGVSKTALSFSDGKGENGGGGEKLNSVIGMEVSVSGIMEAGSQTSASNSPAAKITRVPRFPKIPKVPRLFNLVLLAKNRSGYLNLAKISTEAYTRNPHTPWVDFEYLKDYLSDIILLSGGLKSELYHLLENNLEDQAEKLIFQMKSLMADYQNGSSRSNVDHTFPHYYLEIHDHQIENEKRVVERIIELGQKLQVPLVATNEVCYLDRSDWESFEVLHSIGVGEQFYFSSGVYELTKSKYLPGVGYHFKTYEEMLATFPNHPEAFSNTVKIAGQCQMKLEDGEIHMPNFPLPEAYRERSIDDYLRDDSHRRLKEKIPEVTKDYHDRLEFELKIIIEMGFSSYFIIVADFIDFAKENGIYVGAGRGSAAGSLVSFALGITGLDPIQYGLYFERFLNPERISFPDIDIDFEDQRRGEVIEYVKRKYGTDHVAQIVTFSKLKAKAAFKDVARCFQVDFQFANQLSTYLKDPTDSEKERKGKKSLLQFRYEDDREFAGFINSDPKLLKVYEHSLKLENLTRQIGIHAAGVVIADKPLREYLPLVKTDDNAVLTQYDKDNLEHWFGLIKMDFLGLRNLTVIRDAVILTKKIYQQEVDVDSLQLTDPRAFKLFAQELTEGIFQFSSPGMKRYLKELKPTSIQELIAMNALYRPGPMSWIPVYIAERRGKTPNFNNSEDEENFYHFKKICEDYEPLKQALLETSLIPIYQEQIMEICRIYAGFSLGNADNVRKAMGKKDLALIAKLRNEFVEGAGQKGHSQENAEFVYDKFILPFGGYGFNKSHAACYALLAYQTAYLKGNYPLAFMVALLNSELLANNTTTLHKYMQECVSLEIEVIPPDINASREIFEVRKKYILYGLGALKNVGLLAAKSIIEEREKNGKYTDLGDFLLRNTTESVNKQTVESLIKAGSFDSLGISSDLLFSVSQQLSDRISKERDLQHQGQMNLFDSFESTGEKKESKYLYQDVLDNLADRVPNPISQRELEKEAIGFSLKFDPIMNYRHLFEKYSNIDTGDENSWRLGKAQVCGVAQNISLLYTKKDGKEMMKMELNDGRAVLNVVSFSQRWEKIKTALQENFSRSQKSEENKESNDEKGELVNISALPVLPVQTMSSFQLVEKLQDQVVKLQVVIREDNFNPDKKSFFVNNLELVNIQEEKKPKKQGEDFWIELSGEDYLGEGEMATIKAIFDRYKGSQKVNILIRDRDQRTIHHTSFHIRVCNELKLELSEFAWVKNVK